MKPYLVKLNKWWHNNLKFYELQERYYRITQWISNTLPGRAWYWFRCTFITRYHIIDIRNQGNYKLGWVDRDYAMLLAAFKCLVDFVEGENPFQHVDTSDPDSPNEILRSLYEWWKFGRDKEHEEIAQILKDFNDEFDAKWGDIDFLEELNNREIQTWRYSHPLWQQWDKRHRAIDERDDEQLMLLVRYRRHMWT